MSVAIKLHNTLTDSLEEFRPIDGKKVQMFVCGPTVYNFIHIGNAKTYVQFDLIAKSLRYLGYDLKYLQNITDIDDKIIKRSSEKGVGALDLAEEFSEAYLDDAKALGITSVDKYARASEYISQIEEQVKTLVEKGYAYKISDGYYFDIEKFGDYGKLSGRLHLDPNDAVSRIDENPEKRNQGDFCLWKFSKEGEPSWQSDLGEGRPGWHIEDTAITETELGEQYDIHGGAMDLIFPHHEAEIAQMESASGKKPFVKYWIHTGFLNIDSEKMSKSKDNFLTIRDVLAKGVLPLALRYLFLLSHYRTPVNFSWASLKAAESALKKLQKSALDLPEGGKVDDDYKKKFVEKLEKDFNIPQALALTWTMLKDKDISPEDKRATLIDFDQVFSLDLG